jgi:RNA 2',3'-cyclic 3'-phosphodiesterase
MDSKLRLFLAIEIPESIRAELTRFQQELHPLLPPRVVRWTKPEQFHLTLKFLGNVSTADVPALRETARAVCSTASPLRLRAEDVGFFPNHFSPRIFWVDIKNPDGRLLEFQRQLEAAVTLFAEKEEPKKFTAHITLARFEKLRRGEVEKFAARAQTGRRFGEWTAKEVKLMESKLTQAGALHAILDVFSVKND